MHTETKLNLKFDVQFLKCFETFIIECVAAVKRFLFSHVNTSFYRVSVDMFPEFLRI